MVGFFFYKEQHDHRMLPSFCLWFPVETNAAKSKSVIDVFSYFFKSSSYHCNQYVISSCPVPYPPVNLPCPNGQFYDHIEGCCEYFSVFTLLLFHVGTLRFLANM